MFHGVYAYSATLPSEQRLEIEQLLDRRFLTTTTTAGRHLRHRHLHHRRRTTPPPIQRLARCSIDASFTESDTATVHNPSANVFCFASGTYVLNHYISLRQQ